MSQEITFELNGRPVAIDVEPWSRLIDVIRDGLGLTGTKEGCGEGECGACTVIVDGRTVNSCLFPAIEADGTSVLTIEGVLDPAAGLTPVQQTFIERGGVQCGFCSPGMILSVTDLLRRNADPEEAEIREALAGNLCRCTGYVQIIQAVRAAAVRARESGGEAS